MKLQLTVLALACLIASSATAQDVYLNEVVVEDSAEMVELYNPNQTPLDVGDRKIVGGLGEYEIPDGTTIPALSYLTITIMPPGNIFENVGDEISIADSNSGEVYDQVRFGHAGGAPIPHTGGTVSLCRATDAATDPPLYDETGYSDADFWTLDLTSTFGAANDAPPPALGSTVTLNEFNPGPPNMVEFYNPSVLAVDVDIDNWFLTDGIGEVFLNGTVPSGGVLVLNLPTQIEATQHVYLFDDQGVRVDQIGFFEGPAFPPDLCLVRCPDGAGPYDGHDWLTSGGGETLLILECTLGDLNTTNPECNPTAVEERSWGRIRMMAR
ncbi:MAG: hypothetical protein GF346_12915 [Candidatus Eisenbacteria bacterium]|nr:hypothetical protein [Candidatus Eisenbacteria bacterium]